MNVWHDHQLIGIYTLSPTHCGTGQTTGAVDLPVARDAVGGFPILPATSLKGAARDYCEGKEGLDQKAVNTLFGKPLGAAGEADSSELEAGALVFGEGRLLAYPVRSLNRPFLHITCPLILERLERDLRALGVQGFTLGDWRGSDPDRADHARVADPELAGQPLVLEDLVYEAQEVVTLTGLKTLGGRLAELLPDEEADTRERLRRGLVLIPDEDFKDLMLRVLPVQARIKITEHKTSDNLWYEETLPPDCLFLTFIGQRRQRSSFSEADRRSQQTADLNTLRQVRDRLRRMQMGGNETVGQGLCLWTFWSPPPAESSS